VEFLSAGGGRVALSRSARFMAPPLAGPIESEDIMSDPTLGGHHRSAGAGRDAWSLHAVRAAEQGLRYPADPLRRGDHRPDPCGGGQACTRTGRGG
jgi:hypothetical protein